MYTLTSLNEGICDNIFRIFKTENYYLVVHFPHSFRDMFNFYRFDMEDSKQIACN